MLIMKIPFLSTFLKPSKHVSAGFVVTVSGNNLFCVQVKNLAGRPRVETYAHHQLQGAGSSGFTSAVLDKIRKGMGLGQYRFSTLLSPGEYQLLQMEAPNVPAEELKSAVRWSIKDLLSFHVDEAIIDVLQIPTDSAAGERKKNVYVVAASSAVIKKRSELFQHAHMNLHIIDIPEMAQRNIAALYEKEGRALALLAFDDNGGLLTFTSGGELYLARRIDISIGQLQDANETIRNQFLERLELEMQRSIDHFDRQYSYVSVNRLLVSAPQSLNLVGLLAASLGLPVENLVISEVMDLGTSPELKNEETQVYALQALGAALRQESQA